MLGNRKRKRAPTNGGSDLKRIKTSALILGRKHPHGVQPLGNYFLYGAGSSQEDTRTLSLGYLSMLSDELLIDLMNFFEPTELCKLAQSSKVLYIFTRDEDLWKEFCMDEFEGDWWFQGTWRDTYIKRKNPGFIIPKSDHAIRVQGFYSDLLFHTWQCTAVNIKQWDNGHETINRKNNLSYEEFAKEYLEPNKPVVVTDVIDKWPGIFEKWSKQNLVANYGELEFQIGRISTTMAKYIQYCEKTTEEQPLYLFDNDFGEKAPQLLKDYEVPMYFKEDYFSFIEGKDRPSFRWILVGPQKSGSTFHKDPNSTSAWNALISGAKKWVMFPPDVTPPGVIPSDDGMKVTTSVSVIEWFVNFYSEAMKGEIKPYECVQRSGDLVFIPNGWWHLALNLEESIAVTQNVVNRYNLANVVEFLKKKKKPELWHEFRRVMQEKQPDVLAQAEKVVQEREDEKNKKSYWETLVGDNQPFTLSMFSQ
jgi:hypothetical protein